MQIQISDDEVLVRLAREVRAAAGQLESEVWRGALARVAEQLDPGGCTVEPGPRLRLVS